MRYKENSIRWYPIHLVIQICAIRLDESVGMTARPDLRDISQFHSL